MMNATEQDVWWRSLLVEFLGTFTLVFVGASAVAAAINAGNADGVGLLTAAAAFGLALMTLIYVWGSYSGAHFNPAVSFAFGVTGQMNWGLLLGYWLAQILGGIAAASLCFYFFGNAGATVGSLTNTDAWKSIFLVAILTFLLVIAYLFIYRNPMLAIISGIVIGSVLAFTVLVGGPLVGAGSVNPAAALGSAIFSNNMGSIWIYIIGPLLGALVAALIYKLFVANFDCCYKVDECGKRIQDECGNCIMECERPKLDKCGRPIVDECGKTVTEKVEVLERKYGYKQETYKKEAMEWFNKHGVNLHGLDKKCDTAVMQMPAPVVTVKTTEVVPVIEPVQSVQSVPVIQPSIVPVNPPSQPVLAQSSRSIPIPQGRSAVSASPYIVPKY